MEFITQPIEATDVASDFGCGEAALDSYFRNHALSNHARGIGRAYVLRRPPDVPDLPAVIGFYTLSMCSLERDEVPEAHRKRLPAYPMPVALIGRFARDARVQGKGFGEVLFRDALARIEVAAQTIACFGVITDAKNERAESFYAKRGFVRTKPGPAPFPRRMFLPAAFLKSG